MKIVIRRDSEATPDNSLLELFCALRSPEDALVFAKRPLEAEGSEAAAASRQTEHCKIGDACDGCISHEEMRPNIQTADTDNSLPLEPEIVIDVEQENEEQFKFKIEALDTHFCVGAEQHDRRLQEAVAGILGYRVVSLRGMCVKDSDGNRIKPTITLYVHKDFGFTVPETLEYTKRAPQRNCTGLDIHVVTLSPIITGLLKKTTLGFRAGAALLFLFGEHEKVCARLAQPLIAPAADALMACSITEGVRQVLNSAHASFSKQLKHILLHGCTATDVASFYRKLPKELKDSECEYLVAVIEAFPKTYDARDHFISNLQGYLHASMLQGPSMVCEYLEVKRMRHFRRNIKFSLRKFPE